VGGGGGHVPSKLMRRAHHLSLFTACGYPTCTYTCTAPGGSALGCAYARRFKKSRAVCVCLHLLAAAGPRVLPASGCGATAWTLPASQPLVCLTSSREAVHTLSFPRTLTMMGTVWCLSELGLPMRTPPNQPHVCSWGPVCFCVPAHPSMQGRQRRFCHPCVTRA
jgi:hypothetical protein